MDILDTTSHANAIITDLVKIAEKKGAAEGSTPKTIAAGINLITNTLSGNEEAKSPVIVRALDELVNAVDSGGGGSSDFSTAKVTVINSTPLREYINVVNIVDEDDLHMLDTEFNIGQGTNEFQCVLYKGYGWIDIAQFANSTIEVSGNATYNGEYSISITGDCTITISPAS